MKQSREILRQILVKARQCQQQGLPCLAVFDLDSTLFDVVPRIQKVLESFAELPATQRDFPESLEQLRRARPERGDWGIKDSVLRVGLGSHSHEFHQRLKEHWLQTFFSDEFLHFDVPYEGAQQFVEALSRTNTHIAYLTGRDVHRMGKGSVEVLKKWNFPVGSEQAELVLKPLKGMDDAAFKTDWFSHSDLDKYKHIWFFENEPVNIVSLRAMHPQIDVIFFDSTHSGKAPAPIDLPMIEHFLFDEEE